MLIVWPGLRDGSMFGRGVYVGRCCDYIKTKGATVQTQLVSC